MAGICNYKSKLSFLAISLPGTDENCCVYKQKKCIVKVGESMYKYIINFVFKDIIDNLEL